MEVQWGGWDPINVSGKIVGPAAPATERGLDGNRSGGFNPVCYFTFSLIFPGVRLASDSQFSDFLDGLGPAQLVGRQTLATPAMGKNLSRDSLFFF